jgi:hypothetical protein
MSLNKQYAYNIQLTTSASLILTNYTIGNIFTSNGNVGINNTAPAFTLDIIGNVRVSSGTIVSTNQTITNSVLSNASIGSVIVSGSLTVPNASFTSVTVGSVNTSTGSFVSTVNSTGLGSGGALTVSGGLSVSKDTFLGGNLNISSGSITLTNTTSSTVLGLTNATPSTFSVTNSGANGIVSINSNNGPIKFYTGLNSNTYSGGFDGSSNFSVTNNLNVGGNVTIGGSLFVTGSVISVNTTTLNIIDSNITAGNVLVTTGITTPNIITTNLTSNTLLGTYATIANIQGTFLNISNIGSTFFSSSNLVGTGFSTIANLTSNSIASTFISGTSISASNLFSTSITTTNLLGTLITTSNLIASTCTIPNVVHTNITTSTLTVNDNGFLSVDALGFCRLALIKKAGIGPVISTNNQTAIFFQAANTSDASAVTTNTYTTLMTISTQGNVTMTGTGNAVALSTGNLYTSNISTVSMLVTGAYSAISNTNTLGNLFTTGGNVGINTISPGNTLDVGITGGIAVGYSASAITCQPASSWPSGTHNLISVVFDNSMDKVLFYTPGSVSLTPKLTLQSNGFIGIGTTNPQTGIDSNNGTIRVTNFTGGIPTGRGLELSYSAASSTGNIYSYDRGSGLYNTLNINDKAIIMSSGNVGIGTISPINTLNVIGSIGINTTVATVANGSNQRLVISGDASGIFFSDTAQVLLCGLSNNNKRLGIGLDTNNNIGILQASLSGTTVWPIALNPGGGNIGVGTTSPGYTLDVNGSTFMGTKTGSGVVASSSVMYNNGGFDTASTTHTIVPYNIGANWDTFAGFYMVFVKNTNAGTPKCGCLLISFIKASGQAMSSVTTVHSNKNGSLGTLTAAASGNNIAITTDSDCVMTYQLYTGV